MTRRNLISFGLALLAFSGLRAQTPARYAVDIRVRFTVKRNGREFNDALYFSKEAYAKISQEEIDAQMQARFDAWEAAVEEASNRAPVEPTKVELEAHRASLMEEVTRLDVRIAEKETRR